MATPLSIKDRIEEIMDSFYTAIPSSFRYFIGQKNNSVNLATNYVVFNPRSEKIQSPHIQSAVFDGYAYDFCFDRNVTIEARVQAKTIEILSNVLSCLTAAIKLTNGPAVNIGINWTSQEDGEGCTRQGEMAVLSFDLLFPVPTIKSFLVTPELFEFPVEFVEVLPEYDGYVINPNLEIAPYYASGEKVTL
jgi:hypothetical protein